MSRGEQVSQSDRQVKRIVALGDCRGCCWIDVEGRGESSVLLERREPLAA